MSGHGPLRRVLRRLRRLRRQILAVLGAVALCAPVPSGPAAAQELVAHPPPVLLLESAPGRLVLDLPRQEGEGVTAALADGRPAEVTLAPRDGPPPAVLLLVDVSDPRRDRALRAQAAALAAALTAADRPPAEVALAAFDRRLRVVSPFGDRLLAEALAGLRAVGRETALYESLLDAVTLLAEQPRPRRLLIVLSDGKAEDVDFTPDHVIARARAAGVQVQALVVPPVAGGSLEAQGLRRIAEETGGRWLSLDSAGPLPEAFVRAPFAPVTGGRRAMVTLPSAPTPESARTTLTLTLPGGAVTLPVALAVAAPPPPEPAPVREPAPPAPPAPPLPPWWREPWPLAALALALAGLLGLAVFLALQRRVSSPPRPVGEEAGDDVPAPPVPAPPVPAPPAPGWLDLVGGGRSWPLAEAVTRLGRDPVDNEIVLDDPTVSDHHAVLRRLRDGALQLQDLNSTNGTEVNGRRVVLAVLSGGDVLEIGDTRLRLRLAPAAATLALPPPPPALAAETVDLDLRAAETDQRGGLRHAAG